MEKLTLEGLVMSFTTIKKYLETAENSSDIEVKDRVIKYVKGVCEEIEALYPEYQ